MNSRAGPLESDDLDSPKPTWPLPGESGPIRVELHPTDTFEARSATQSAEVLICPSCQHPVAARDA